LLTGNTSVKENLYIYQLVMKMFKYKELKKK